MFRPLKRSRQALSREECLRVLTEETRGVLSVLGDDGYPYGMPMNHFCDPETGLVYFHCGRGGHRADALARCDKASFCVYDHGVRAEGDWALTVSSVIVFGRIEVIEDRGRVYDAARRLGAKFPCGAEYIEQEIAKSGPATVLLALRPEHISGKRVHEA